MKNLKETLELLTKEEIIKLKKLFSEEDGRMLSIAADAPDRNIPFTNKDALKNSPDKWVKIGPTKWAFSDSKTGAISMTDSIGEPKEKPTMQESRKVLKENIPVHTLSDKLVNKKLKTMEGTFLDELEKMAMDEPEIKKWLKLWNVSFSDIPSMITAIRRDKKIWFQNSIVEKLNELIKDYYEELKTLSENVKVLNSTNMLTEQKNILFEQIYTTMQDRCIVFGKKKGKDVIGIHYKVGDKSLFELFDMNSARIDNRNKDFMLFDPIPEGMKYKYELSLGEEKVRGNGFVLFPTKFLKHEDNGAVVIRTVADQHIPQFTISKQRYLEIKKNSGLIKEMHFLTEKIGKGDMVNLIADLLKKNDQAPSDSGTVAKPDAAEAVDKNTVLSKLLELRPELKKDVEEIMAGKTPAKAETPAAPAEKPELYDPEWNAPKSYGKTEAPVAAAPAEAPATTAVSEPQKNLSPNEAKEIEAALMSSFPGEPKDIEAKKEKIEDLVNLNILTQADADELLKKIEDFKPETEKPKAKSKKGGKKSKKQDAPAIDAIEQLKNEVIDREGLDRKAVDAKDMTDILSLISTEDAKKFFGEMTKITPEKVEELWANETELFRKFRDILCVKKYLDTRMKLMKNVYEIMFEPFKELFTQYSELVGRPVNDWQMVFEDMGVWAKEGKKTTDYKSYSKELLKQLKQLTSISDDQLREFIESDIATGKIPSNIIKQNSNEFLSYVKNEDFMKSGQIPDESTKESVPFKTVAQKVGGPKFKKEIVGEAVINEGIIKDFTNFWKKVSKKTKDAIWNNFSKKIKRLEKASDALSDSIAKSKPTVKKENKNRINEADDTKKKKEKKAEAPAPAPEPEPMAEPEKADASAPIPDPAGPKKEEPKGEPTPEAPETLAKEPMPEEPPKEEPKPEEPDPEEVKKKEEAKLKTYTVLVKMDSNGKFAGIYGIASDPQMASEKLSKAQKEGEESKEKFSVKPYTVNENTLRKAGLKVIK